MASSGRTAVAVVTMPIVFVVSLLFLLPLTTTAKVYWRQDDDKESEEGGRILLSPIKRNAIDFITQEGSSIPLSSSFGMEHWVNRTHAHAHLHALLLDDQICVHLMESSSTTERICFERQEYHEAINAFPRLKQRVPTWFGQVIVQDLHLHRDTSFHDTTTSIIWPHSTLMLTMNPMTHDISGQLRTLNFTHIFFTAQGEFWMDTIRNQDYPDEMMKEDFELRRIMLEQEEKEPLAQEEPVDHNSNNNNNNNHGSKRRRIRTTTTTTRGEGKKGLRHGQQRQSVDDKQIQQQQQQKQAQRHRREEEQSDDGSVIDINVVYTKRSMCTAANLVYPCDNTESNRSPMETKILDSIAWSNKALDDSGALFQLRLVDMSLDPFYDENDPNRHEYQTYIDMYYLFTDKDTTRPLGTMWEKHDEYGADITALIHNQANIKYCGETRPYTATVNSAFSSVHLFCLPSSLTHEIGHNIGADHDPDNRAPTSLSGDPSYASGYLHSEGKFRTIMSYRGSCVGPCPRIGMFSSASGTYFDDATGDALHDNVRRMNEERFTVANYNIGLDDNDNDNNNDDDANMDNDDDESAPTSTLPPSASPSMSVTTSSTLWAPGAEHQYTSAPSSSAPPTLSLSMLPSMSPSSPEEHMGDNATTTSPAPTLYPSLG